LRETTIGAAEAEAKSLEELLRAEPQVVSQKQKAPDATRLAALDRAIAEATSKLARATDAQKKSEKPGDVVAARQALVQAEDDRRKLMEEAPEVDARVENPHWRRLADGLAKARGRVEGAKLQIRSLIAQEKEQVELAKRAPQLAAEGRQLAGAVAAAKAEWDARAAARADADRDLERARGRGTLSVRELVAPVRPDAPDGAPALAFVGAGVAIGALAGLLAAFAADGMDRSFREVDAVARFLGAPTMGAIPTIRTPAEEAARRKVRRKRVALLAGLAVVAAVAAALAAVGDAHTLRDVVKSVLG
jgi:hypothetical protein